MTLRKIIKEKDKIVEKYYIEAPFMRSCKVPEGYRDIIEAVSSKLEEYCVFSKVEQATDSMEITLGGPIPDHLWQTTIETEDNYGIDIIISQSYEQPLGRLSEANAKMKYTNGISKEDLDIIRGAFTSSGLERID